MNWSISGGVTFTMTGSRQAKCKDPVTRHFDRIFDSMRGRNCGLSGQFRGGVEVENITL